MPMDKKRYPADWDEISNRIRFDRADGVCEQCGVAHGAEIVRSSVDPARFIVYNRHEAVYTRPDGQWIRLSEIPDEFDIVKSVTVILTVHHIGAPKDDGSPGDPHDKMDVRDCNLIALCQRCHLLADQPHHIAKRKETYALKRAARLEADAERRANLGQLSLL